MANNVKIINGCVAMGSTVTSITKDSTEIPVGEYWISGGKARYRAVHAEKKGSCTGCDFLDKWGVCTKHSGSHPCTAYGRSDKTWIIYKKVKK